MILELLILHVTSGVAFVLYILLCFGFKWWWWQKKTWQAKAYYLLTELRQTVGKCSSCIAPLAAVCVHFVYLLIFIHSQKTTHAVGHSPSITHSQKYKTKLVSSFGSFLRLHAHFNSLQSFNSSSYETYWSMELCNLSAWSGLRLSLFVSRRQLAINASFVVLLFVGISREEVKKNKKFP